MAARPSALRIFTLAAWIVWGGTHLPARADSSVFSQSEFPNLFVSEEYRGLAPESIPTEAVAQSRNLVEQALGSVFDRIVVPIVPNGESKAKMVRYFPLVQRELSAIDSTVRILPSGGVVRSAISYLYDEIRVGLEMNPPQSTEETLSRIIRSQEDLPGIRVRGVGSDFDVLLTCAPGAFDRLSRRLTEITNSAESAFSVRSDQSGLKSSLFVIGDVREYSEQVGRTTRQGGSTIDWLAFDRSTGKFVEPPGALFIVNDMIRGWYSYLAPTDPKFVEDAAKQTIRGLRPFLELPFLRIKDDRVLRSELQALTPSAGSEKTALGFKALEQFDKMVRNARYSAAHNRFHRAPAGSVEELVRTIEKQSGRTLIPEFVDQRALAGGTSRLGGLSAQSLRSSGALVSIEDFKKCCTNDGTIFHGTKSAESSLAILRGGLFISKPGQGKAYYGRGAYATQFLSTALAYAEGGGIVFELEVKDDPKVNILDWDQARNLPEIQVVEAQAKAAGKDVFEVLAREHGIDIIVNSQLLYPDPSAMIVKGRQILIQNSEAFDFPNRIEDLVKPYAHLALDGGQPIDTRIKAFDVYRKYRAYVEELGGKLPPLDELEFRKMLVDSFRRGMELYAASDKLKEIGIGSPEIEKRLLALVLDQTLSDTSPALYALSLLTQENRESEKHSRFLMRLASEDPREEIRSVAVHRLADMRSDAEPIAKFLLEMTRDPARKVQEAAYFALGKQAQSAGASRKLVLRTIVGVLKGGNESQARSLLLALDANSLSVPEIFDEVLRIATRPSNELQGIATGALRNAVPSLTSSQTQSLIAGFSSVEEWRKLPLAATLIDQGTIAPELAKPLLEEFRTASRYPSFEVEKQGAFLETFRKLLPLEEVQVELVNSLAKQNQTRFTLEALKSLSILAPAAKTALADALNASIGYPRVPFALLGLQHGVDQSTAIQIIESEMGKLMFSDFRSQMIRALVANGSTHPELPKWVSSIAAHSYVPQERLDAIGVIHARNWRTPEAIDGLKKAAQFMQHDVARAARQVLEGWGLAASQADCGEVLKNTLQVLQAQR